MQTNKVCHHVEEPDTNDPPLVSTPAVLSETFVDQANKEKERVDREEKICLKVTGQLGRQGLKRSKADEVDLLMESVYKVMIMNHAVYTLANFDCRQLNPKMR